MVNKVPEKLWSAILRLIMFQRQLTIQFRIAGDELHTLPWWFSDPRPSLQAFPHACHRPLHHPHVVDIQHPSDFLDTHFQHSNYFAYHPFYVNLLNHKSPDLSYLGHARWVFFLRAQCRTWRSSSSIWTLSRDGFVILATCRLACLICSNIASEAFG